MAQEYNANAIPDDVIREAHNFIAETLHEIGDDYISPSEVQGLMDIVKGLSKAQFISLQTALVALHYEMEEVEPTPVTVVVLRPRDSGHGTSEITYKH